MSDRTRINRYAHRAEDKAEQRLKELGWELKEDTGRRTQKLGDRIMFHEDTGITLMIDHKSTQNKESFKILRRALEKIKKEAAQHSKATLPAITFSFYGGEKMYIIFDLNDLNGVMY